MRPGHQFHLWVPLFLQRERIDSIIVPKGIINGIVVLPKNSLLPHIFLKFSGGKIEIAEMCLPNFKPCPLSLMAPKLPVIIHMEQAAEEIANFFPLADFLLIMVNRDIIRQLVTLFILRTFTDDFHLKILGQDGQLRQNEAAFSLRIRVMIRNKYQAFQFSTPYIFFSKSGACTSQ